MNKDALIKIFDLYSSALYNFALRLSGDPVSADHIVGDVFAKLLEQLSTGNGPKTNLRSYLYEMTYHRMIDEARSARRNAPLEAAALLGEDPHSASLPLEDQLLFKQILDVLRNKLTEDQRHVIVLRFLEEFSLKETAVIMGKTVNHVKVLQNRGIAALRKSFEASEIRKAVPSSRVGPLSKVLGI